MMAKLTSIFIFCGLLIAGLLGVTLSLPSQAPALILLGVAGLIGSVLVFKVQYDYRLMIPVLLALMYFLVRAWLSPVRDLAHEDLFLIMAAGLFYILAGPVNGLPQTRIGLAIVLFTILCAHILSAVIQLLGGEGYSLVWLFTEGQRPEGNVISGMYGYRGSFANFVVISGMVAICLGVWGQFGKWFRITLVVVGAVALILACLAQSRSAMMSLGVGGVVLLMMLWMSVSVHESKLRKKIRTAVVICGCLAMVMVAIGATLVFQSRAQNTTLGSDVMFDSSVRLAFWPMAIEQFVDHPIVGAGSRSFSYECFRYWSPNLDSGEANPEFVHNEYLQVLADYGFIGFLLVVGLLGVHLVIGVMRTRSLSKRLGLNGIKSGSNAMALTIAGTVGIVVMSVHVIFDFRTHLMANLLVLMCCLVWVLPVAKSRGHRRPWLSYLVLPSILGVSGCAILLGLTQFRGGFSLLMNGMATEHGSWVPAAVNRDVWIPSLEKSVEIAPSYRRYLKLGTLYRLEADQAKESEKTIMLHKAVEYYEKAADRHAYEPVSQVNLASIHAFLKNFDQSEAHFKKSNELGASRERWFRIHTKWADMQRQWAGALWVGGDKEAAGEHYLRALEILRSGSVQSSDTVMVLLMVIIEYTRMLDSENDFEAADRLFTKIENDLPTYIVNSLRHNIRREMGDHYLRKGKYLWYQRKPEEANEALLKAAKCYQIHQIVLKGREDEQWKKSYDEVKQILKFFKATGVGVAK